MFSTLRNNLNKLQDSHVQFDSKKPWYLIAFPIIYSKKRKLDQIVMKPNT